MSASTSESHLGLPLPSITSLASSAPSISVYSGPRYTDADMKTSLLEELRKNKFLFQPSPTSSRNDESVLSNFQQPGSQGERGQQRAAINGSTSGQQASVEDPVTSRDPYGYRKVCDACARRKGPCVFPPDASECEYCVKNAKTCVRRRRKIRFPGSSCRTCHERKVKCKH